MGIQKGTPGMAAGPKLSINQPYLNGISITYGTPRKHIWSYTASISENQVQVHDRSFTCPCSKYCGALPLAFISDHYYYESWTNGWASLATYSTGVPLWDSKGCGDQTCCTQPNLPWFFRQLPLVDTDDVEAKICYDEDFQNECTLVKETRLYVQ